MRSMQRCSVSSYVRRSRDRPVPRSRSPHNNKKHSQTSKARSVVRTLDNTNDLTFLRIRSKKHEIMISPDKEHMLIVIQRSDGAASASASSK